jgi:hypothetical protein
VVFVVLGAGVVLYAQGWRFDFALWRAKKVGAIYVQSFPRDASIFLNGKPVPNQSGFLSYGTLISELFPRNYSLTLKENGYLDWHEDAEVLPSLVAALKYAVLVPDAPATTSAASFKNFFVASGELISQTASDAIVWRGNTIGHGGLVSESSNFKNIIFKSARTGAYLLYDFDAGTSTNLSAFFAGAIRSIAIDPSDATKVVATDDRRIWIFDTALTSSSMIEQVPVGTVLGTAPPAPSPALIAWTRFRNASDTTNVVLYDKFTKTMTKSALTVPGKTLALAWATPGLLAVLQNDGALYLYDSNAATFQKLADSVKTFSVADDGSAIAALEEKSLEVLPLADAQTYHRFNLPDVKDAVRTIWYKDMNHLFVAYPDSVSFLDIDDLGLRNFVAVAKGTSPLYKPQENTFYLINSVSKLAQFDFPS